MRTLIQISPREAQGFYRVPTEIAVADGNIFYGVERHPRDLDGPWPLLIFLKHKNRPDVVTFRVLNLQLVDLEFESFNPLTGTGRSLGLSPKAFGDLTFLLQEYSQRLPSRPKKNQKMFKKIEDTKLAYFHLHPEWFRYSKLYYYYQVYDPLNVSEENTDITIIVLSADLIASPGLALRIMSFPLQKLKNPSFNPLNNSYPQINLDQNGIQEFASLLQTWLDHPAGELG